VEKVVEKVKVEAERVIEKVKIGLEVLAIVHTEAVGRTIVDVRIVVPAEKGKERIEAIVDLRKITAEEIVIRSRIIGVKIVDVIVQNRVLLVRKIRLF